MIGIRRRFRGWGVIVFREKISRFEKMTKIAVQSRISMFSVEKTRISVRNTTLSKSKILKFIDLFAGIGGFHLAMKNLGKCVFSSEIDAKAVATYRQNFDCEVFGDITEISEAEIPDFDFLCAGFPCQPFSKGGARHGFSDTRGTLFFDVCRIVDFHRPKFILLENVPNLASHDHGKTYETILRNLKKLEYAVSKNPIILSPDNFGIPVHRPRIYIPAIRKDFCETEFLDFDFSSEFQNCEKDIYSIVEDSGDFDAFKISDYEERILEMWDDFYQNIDLKIIGFPVWMEEFGKNYLTDDLPKWKQNFIAKNRDLYARNKKFIDLWLRKNQNLEWCHPTHRKFEWQAGTHISSVFEGLIQFRPSGVRVRKPDKFSTLVAMNHAQIVGKFRRRLSPDETKKIQNFPDDFKLHADKNTAMKQLGNAVNVEVVRKVILKMLKFLAKKNGR